MWLPVSIDSFADADPGETPAGAGPVTLARTVEHPQPIPAAADHPSHLASYGIILFVVLLVVLGVMGRPVLRWRRRAGEVQSRATVSR